MTAQIGYGWVWLTILVILPSCAPRARHAESEAELLQLQSLQRQAHLEKDAELLTSIFAEDFLSVQNGEISRPSRDESRAMFQAYFDRVEFLAWDDIVPPRIRVSADGTFAHVLVHKRVRLKGRSGEESETEFAWLETYERLDRAWRLTAVVSTRRPAPGG